MLAIRKNGYIVTSERNISNSDNPVSLLGLLAFETIGDCEVFGLGRDYVFAGYAFFRCNGIRLRIPIDEDAAIGRSWATYQSEVVWSNHIQVVQNLRFPPYTSAERELIRDLCAAVSSLATV